MNMHCRPAVPADASRLVEIYAPYVANTAISFAVQPPVEEEFLAKLASPYPFLVCQEQGRVVGYAYAGPYRSREAYRWDVELSIYVEAAAVGRGVGKRLLGGLLALLKAQGYQNVYSCITLPNPGSIGLHRSFGFQQIALFENAGYKLGAWRSVVWLHLPIGDCPVPPREPMPFQSLTKETVSACLA